MCIRDRVYPILYIDAIHYSVRDNGVSRKLAAYVILGINTEGKKEVLTITIGDNESCLLYTSLTQVYWLQKQHLQWMKNLVKL